MSLVVTKSLRCDKCGVKYIPSSSDLTLDLIRKEARLLLWTSMHGKDFCPRCQRKYQVPEANRPEYKFEM